MHSLTRNHELNIAACPVPLVALVAEKGTGARGCRGGTEGSRRIQGSGKTQGEGKGIIGGGGMTQVRANTQGEVKDTWEGRT